MYVRTTQASHILNAWAMPDGGAAYLSDARLTTHHSVGHDDSACVCAHLPKYHNEAYLPECNARARLARRCAKGWSGRALRGARLPTKSTTKRRAPHWPPLQHAATLLRRMRSFATNPRKGTGDSAPLIGSTVKVTASKGSDCNGAEATRGHGWTASTSCAPQLSEH